VDTEGDGIQSGGVGAAIGTATGSFSAPQHVADTRTSNVLAAASPSGETVLAWGSADDAALGYAVRPAGGAFGPARAAPGFRAGALTAGGDGTVLAVWSDGGIQAAARPPQGDFAGPETISASGAFPVAAGRAVVWLAGDVLRISLRR